MSATLARRTCEPETDIAARLRAEGWAVARGVLSVATVDQLTEELERTYELCRAVQVVNGVAQGMTGSAHHLVGRGAALDGLLDALPLTDEIDAVFGGKFILLNYGGVLNRPDERCYTAKPHRDVRGFSPAYPLSLNMLIMLDDATPESGATWVLPGSHRVEALPTADAFARGAVQITGRRGDVALFDSLLVHAAGENRSARPRRALTLCFGRPFMKPQMDWPRYLPPERHAALSESARQLLGFNARVPTSLAEYYQPPERWAFKADQR